MTPPTDQAHAARPIVEAPPEIAATIERWIDEGFPRLITHELEWDLQPYRGVRLLTEGHVVWLRKASDSRDDEVCVMARSMPLGRKEEQAPTGS
jgi:hypothetical protein